MLVGLYGDIIRSYVSEPEPGRRNWKVEALEKELVYGNRRRLKGARSKRLQKKRAELAERTFAHLYETGGMRRLHLRGRRNALKRLLIHGAAFNLGLVMRQALGVGTPPGLRSLMASDSALAEAHAALICAGRATLTSTDRLLRSLRLFANRIGAALVALPSR